MPDVTPAAPPTAVATAVFSVPAETVWSYRLDFANLPEYNPDVQDVTRVADGTGDACGWCARARRPVHVRLGRPAPARL